MTLTLTVDGERWRSHLRSVADSVPGVVPVIKGNGYGFGNHRLARKADWLGADTVAVGTYEELAEVGRRFPGDLLVLAPWREFAAEPAPDLAGRTMHTVGRLEDLDLLLGRPDRPRVMLERMTSMRRHGFDAAGLAAAARRIAEHRDGAGVRFEGVSAHLPLDAGGGGNRAEFGEILAELAGAGLDRSDDRGPATVWVSHLGPDDLRALGQDYPGLRLRPRIGTALWLGDRGALRVAARVLDVHPVRRGQPFGYRGRSAARDGVLLVVSGGTAHGIGLEAPTGDLSLRSRAGALARGGLDATGRARSPYLIDGRRCSFAEPPHMQSSLLVLPSGAPAPAVGDEIELRVRFTTTAFDRVVLG